MIEAITQLRFPVPGQFFSLTTELTGQREWSQRKKWEKNLIVSWIGKCMEIEMPMARTGGCPEICTDKYG